VGCKPREEIRLGKKQTSDEIRLYEREKMPIRHFIFNEHFSFLTLRRRFSLIESVLKIENKKLKAIHKREVLLGGIAWGQTHGDYYQPALFLLMRKK
jgi:hypothetical protein